MTGATNAGRRFVFRPVGAFSLAAAKAFVASFAPFMGPEAGAEDGDDCLVLAFLSDDGRPVAVRLHQTAERVVADVLEGDGGDGLRAQVARILSLDTDAGPYEAIEDEVITRVRDQHPGLRPVHYPTPYEAATWAVLIQRTQRVQAANIRHKLAERHGAVVTIDGVDHLTAIPPDEMAAIREVWGVPAVKVPWLRAVGRAELEGDLDAESLRAMDPAEALARLREIDGIGPFGAELILVRGAAAPDVFARNEPLLHRVITHHYGLADPSRADLVAIAERWRPRRSWATFLLRQATPR
ncbi:MAG TPA: hypothetical protein VIT24_06550 [Acidimicrobiales bacterium]